MHKNTHTAYLTITLKRRGKKEKRKKVKPDEKSIGEANSHCSSIILFLPHLATTLRTAYRFNLYMLLNSKYRSRLKQYCYHWDWYWALVERTPLINNWFVQQNSGCAIWGRNIIFIRVEIDIGLRIVTWCHLILLILIFLWIEKPTPTSPCSS